MYRKVPTDLLEGTKRGSILSLMASFVMLSLFLLETGAFFRKT
jgi:Endoplasmic Reticulum-Golgi Intermediate Compartment (ERGIC)